MLLSQQAAGVQRRIVDGFEDGYVQLARTHGDERQAEKLEHVSQALNADAKCSRVPSGRGYVGSGIVRNVDTPICVGDSDPDNTLEPKEVEGPIAANATGKRYGGQGTNGRVRG